MTGTSAISAEKILNISTAIQSEMVLIVLFSDCEMDF